MYWARRSVKEVAARGVMATPAGTGTPPAPGRRPGRRPRAPPGSSPAAPPAPRPKCCRPPRPARRRGRRGEGQFGGHLVDGTVAEGAPRQDCPGGHDRPVGDPRRESGHRDAEYGSRTVGRHHPSPDDLVGAVVPRAPRDLELRSGRETVLQVPEADEVDRRLQRRRVHIGDRVGGQGTIAGRPCAGPTGPGWRRRPAGPRSGRRTTPRRRRSG
jgi:hypothetical protein